jgi:hypothetical protein
MLAPDSRVVLLDQLRPPVGYTVDAAVATTFTLDLSAALIPPLAFASFAMSGTPDPVAALEAVRNCADRLDIFAQAGQLTVPRQPSDLMAFLEPMVHAVRRPRPGHLFHPKVWLLRYRGPDGEPSYRLLCLTRNLTNDHSWDLAVCLDGVDSGKRAPANRPLVQFIRALPGLTTTPLPQDRRDRIVQLAEDAYRIRWEHPEDVRDIQFHAFGISGVRPDCNFSGYRHLVVAPFVTDGGLDVVAPASPDMHVVSRPEALDQLAPQTVSALAPFVVSGIAGLADDRAPDGLGAEQILTGLHAKFYIAERARLAHLFVGSANATEAAFRGNVEFLVELIGGTTRLGVANFLGEDAPFRNMVEEYRTDGGHPPDPDDEAWRRLADLLRYIAAIPHTITVSARPGGDYTLDVTTDDPLPVPDGYRVTAELLTRPGEAQVLSAGPVRAAFGPAPLADITAFLAVRATSDDGRFQGGTVVRGMLRDDPAGRLDEVLARQVDTPEKFLKFLALLLGLANSGIEAMFAGADGMSDGYAAVGPGAGVFEMLVRALADRPEALDDLDRLVERLRVTENGRMVLPDGFEDLWTVIEEARRKLRAVTP